MRLVREAKTPNRLVPYPCVVVKIKKNISSAKVPPEKPGVPIPHPEPPAQVSSIGKRNPHNCWL